jgi:hypothetical protein
VQPQVDELDDGLGGVQAKVEGITCHEFINELVYCI